VKVTRPINAAMEHCPHNEMKLKQNCFETVLKLFGAVLFQPKQKKVKQPYNVLAVLVGIRCLCKTAVYHAVTQTLVNKHRNYTHL